MSLLFNPLSANPTKWSNTLKQFVGNLLTNCLSVFDHFMKMAVKGLKLLIVEVISADQFQQDYVLSVKHKEH